MKRFIWKTVIFTGTFIVFIFLLFLVNKFFGDFKIGDKNRILIIGNSHPECAFNDDFIPGLANFSESGDTYLYTYIKAKKLIEQNPHVDKLLVELSNNQIKRDMDSWIWDDMYLSYRFQKYAPFMDKESIDLLFENNAKGVIATIPYVSRINFRMLLTRLDYTKVLGGYLRLDKNKADELVSKLSFEEEPKNVDDSLSIENIEYLHKLIGFCKQRGVELFLIRSPLHLQSTILRNEELFRDVLLTEFSDIEFLDFSRFPLSNNKYADLEHLNYNGAKEFSLWFSSLLEQGLFEKAEKQEFIDAQIRQLSDSFAHLQQ